MEVTEAMIAHRNQPTAAELLETLEHMEVTVAMIAHRNQPTAAELLHEIILKENTLQLLEKQIAQVQQTPTSSEMEFQPSHLKYCHYHQTTTHSDEDCRAQQNINPSHNSTPLSLGTGKKNRNIYKQHIQSQKSSV